MNVYDREVLPRITKWLLDRPEIFALRKKTTAGLHGDVVEIGFGSGLNLPALPPEVERLHAVDPDQTGRRMAGELIARSPVDVEFVGLDGQRLPLADASMDGALSTFTMCSIPDLGKALDELWRVLKPGAELHFLEHGRSDEPAVARRQARINPFYTPFARGCRLDVPIAESVRAAGFEITSLSARHRGFPKVASYVLRGVARKPAQKKP